MGWESAGPHEVLAITGWRIDNILIVKKKWVFPGQKVSQLSAYFII
jgi:hypothetical protein